MSGQSPGEMALEIGRILAEALIKLVPAPVAQQLISDADIRRANALGELADEAKFGSER